MQNLGENGLRVGVVIPTLNEEANVASVLSRLKDLGYLEILIIDGNSKDNTVAIAKSYGAKVVSQNGNGKGDAVRQVFNNGYLDVDAVALMDADGSMMPEEIPRFVEALKTGADVVKGSRFRKGGYTYDMSFIRRMGNSVFLMLVNLSCRVRYTDLCYGFGVFTKKAMRDIAPILRSTNFEIETEIFIKAKKLGLKIAEVPSVELRRNHGKSNLKALGDGLRILKTIFRESIQK
jgi:glycosyltransferase involved in cell wall biosynthesis